MLKVKIGGGLQNFFYLWDMTFDYWWEAMCFLILVVDLYIFDMPFYSSRLLRNISLSSFIFGPEVVSIWVVVFLIPLTQLV